MFFVKLLALWLVASLVLVCLIWLLTKLLSRYAPSWWSNYIVCYVPDWIDLDSPYPTSNTVLDNSPDESSTDSFVAKTKIEETTQ